jgi:hypothetical protein
MHPSPADQQRGAAVTTRSASRPAEELDGGPVTSHERGEPTLAAGRDAAGSVARWIRDRSLTLVLLALFALTLAGQILTGWHEFNETRLEHGAPSVSMAAYLMAGHPWEALFENWESEFLQMAVFVVFTTFLYQKGSPESRRPGPVAEPQDADPRDFADREDAPWPVRRGGWILTLYEHSLGLAFFLLFVVSWLGHIAGGWAEYRSAQALHGQPAEHWVDYLTSSQLWFQSFQNWQSEFLSVAAMVWLAVYLRQRGSPESKPVHAPHGDTGT